MNAHAANGARQPNLTTHYQAFYAISSHCPSCAANCLFCLYVETERHRQEGYHFKAIPNPSTGRISIGSNMFRNRVRPGPNRHTVGVCQQPIGWVAKNSISGIMDTCERIPVGAPKRDSDGPLLPGQPPRDGEEWVNTAIDLLFTRRLLLPLGPLDAKGPIYNIEEGRGPIDGLRLWLGTPRTPVVGLGAAQVRAAEEPEEFEGVGTWDGNPTVRGRAANAGRRSLSPHRVQAGVADAPRPLPPRPAQDGAALEGVVHPAQGLVHLAQTGWMHTAPALPWEHRLRLGAFLISLCHAVYSMKEGWMDPVSYLLFVLLQVCLWCLW